MSADSAAQGVTSNFPGGQTQAPARLGGKEHPHAIRMEAGPEARVTGRRGGDPRGWVVVKTTLQAEDTSVARPAVTPENQEGDAEGGLQREGAEGRPLRAASEVVRQRDEAQ